MVNLEISAPKEPKGEIRLAEQMEAYNAALTTRIDEAFDAYSVILLDRLADLTPIGETGETAQSWEVFHSGVWQLFITNSNQPISTFLSEGTMAHWVEPVTAKALHWIGPDGGSYFSKGHMVSGIKPLFIEWNALQQTSDALDELMEKAESQAFDDAFERSINVEPPGLSEDLGGIGDYLGYTGFSDEGEEV